MTAVVEVGTNEWWGLINQLGSLLNIPEVLLKNSDVACLHAKKLYFLIRDSV